jgi:redox-sensitive bicupin YhaK (pirin superfamily)
MVAVKSPETRNIIYTTRGRSHGGPITRLVSPGDLGEVMKPFVFLDLISIDARRSALPSLEYGWHPHSGIATVTVPLDGAFRALDTTGTDAVVRAGGVEWMRAGRGVWHTGEVATPEARGFQLWVALPPELELAASEAAYIQPEQVPIVGPARVILGSYEGGTSPIAAPPGMTYLQVNLADGERWRYQPPAGHEVAWVAVMDGTLDRIAAGSVAIFEPSEQAIDFTAHGATRFVLGSAVPHRHGLHLGNYSVHTTADALVTGEDEIRRIGRELRDNGTLRRSRPAVAL